MKIEMAESLFYSWLRHVKECLIAQNNWKASPVWELKRVTELQTLLDDVRTQFESEFHQKIFDFRVKKDPKKDFEKKFYQTIKQGECDAVGMALCEGKPVYYAVDVAFHENGLNYHGKGGNVSGRKVVEKCVRTALCLYGYFEAEEAEIVFASPLIQGKVYGPLPSRIDFLNDFFHKAGLNYTFRLICNDAFFTEVIDPIRIVSGKVHDTAELFMRAYQLLAMFRQNSLRPVNAKGTGKKGTTGRKGKRAAIPSLPYSAATVPDRAAYDALLVGQIAKTVFRRMLESGLVPNDEIEKMLTAEDSKAIFGINFPLLSETGGRHYYAAPLKINGKEYYLCIEWYAANKEKLIDWIKAHPEIEAYIYSLDAMPEETEEPEED